MTNKKKNVISVFCLGVLLLLKSMFEIAENAREVSINFVSFSEKKTKIGQPIDHPRIHFFMPKLLYDQIKV